MNEKMVFMNMMFSFCSAIIASDIECLAGRLDFETTRSFFFALAQFCPVHVGILLVTAWITIVDGGKKKKTPVWARYMENFSTAYGYCVTTFLSCAGYNICLTDNNIPEDDGVCEYNHYPSEDGKVSAYKRIVLCSIYVTYGVLAGVYGSKITMQLKSGKGKKASPEEKKIRRWCYLVCTLYMGMTFTSIGGAMYERYNRTIKMPVPCETSWSPGFMFPMYMVQFAICYAQQPMKKGKKFTTHVVSSAFAKFKSTNRSSSRRSKKSSKSTGGERAS